jgi:branched-chain amino acid aminotransferase
MNGELVDWEDATVHVGVHGLHYGSGVFEGIRRYETPRGPAVFRLTDHMRRLDTSARLIYMTLPYSVDELVQATHELLAANALPEVYIRPIAFYGYGTLGVPPRENPVYVAILSWPWGTYLGEEALAKGIRAKISTFARHHVNAKMTNGKTCGDYVNSILAKREALLDGFDEAIMLDTQGLVSECTGENIFVVRDGKIRTPPLHSILDGITRESVIEIARDRGFEVIESALTRDDLYIADEIFLTGTAAELTPVREVDHRTIGEGKRGPVAGELQKAFFEVVTGADSRYARWRTFVD